MHLEVTFRNLGPREEVRRRAAVLFKKLERFLDPAADGNLIVGVEHDTAVVEMVLSTWGTVHKAVEEDPDLRTALDRLFHRVEVQLRRTKERRIDRRKDGEEGEVVEDAGPVEGDPIDDEYSDLE